MRFYATFGIRMPQNEPAPSTRPARELLYCPNCAKEVADPLTCGALVVNRLTRQALIAGDRLTLTTKEFGVLEHLVAHAEQVVTRSALLEHVWERTRDPDSNVIDVHVARLRSKLREGDGVPRIATVRGVGFMLTTG